MDWLNVPDWHKLMKISKEDFIEGARGKILIESLGVKAVVEIVGKSIYWHGYCEEGYREVAEKVLTSHLNLLWENGCDRIVAPISSEFKATRNFAINKLGFFIEDSELIWRK